MEKLKLKNKILGGTILILSIIGFLFYYNSDKYIYENVLFQILNVKDVVVKHKSLADSWSIGEWYICEIYEISDKTADLFISSNHNNILYFEEEIWVRKDWNKLPIDKAFVEIETLVMNYQANKKLDEIISEMREVIAMNSGYYSFMYQPTVENPQRILFFLFDDVKNKIFIVDLNY